MEPTKSRIDLFETALERLEELLELLNDQSRREYTQFSFKILITLLNSKNINNSGAVILESPTL